MKNPYMVLGVPQNATNAEIIKSQINAIRRKEYSPNEVAKARVELCKPSSRLATDFTFPVFDDFSTIEEISTNKEIKDIDLDSFDVDKYNSLK